MLRSKGMVLGIPLLLASFFLSAWVTGNDETTVNDSFDNDLQSSSVRMGNGQMDEGHSDSVEIPEGLKKAKNPEFPVGSKAIIKANHMKGMEGATATIVGAYDTIAYAISYTPTTGGKRVTNHKWVIQEEIKEAKDDVPLKPGTKVTIEASHMKGMKGATATIESAIKTTVYMVDYTPTTGGKRVINHKWLIEDELSPVD